MPMDLLLRRISDLRISESSNPRLPTGCGTPAPTSIGVGLEGPIPEQLAGKCWMYFPEPELPFYRVTVFSNYSPNNVPNPGRQWSLMAEVSEPFVVRRKPRAPAARRDVRRTLDGLKAARLIPPDAAVASLWHRRVEHGYPTPVLGRDGCWNRSSRRCARGTSSAGAGSRLEVRGGQHGSLVHAGRGGGRSSFAAGPRSPSGLRPRSTPDLAEHPP